MTRFNPMFLSFTLFLMLGCIDVTEPDPDPKLTVEAVAFSGPMGAAAVREPSWSLSITYIHGKYWASVLERNPKGRTEGCLLLADRTVAATWNNGVDATETLNPPRELCHRPLTWSGGRPGLGPPEYVVAYRVVGVGPDKWDEYTSSISVSYGDWSGSMTLYNVGDGN